MAIFGRKTARQRLRRATRESLAIPAFSSTIDCTPWVIGGLWPAELTTTPETSNAAEYLRLDLQRIVESANEELKAIRRTMMPDSVGQAEEARVINAARGFAVRRVESTVRHLHTTAQAPPAENRRLEGPETTVILNHRTGAGRQDADHGRHAAGITEAQDEPRHPVEAARDSGSEPGVPRAEPAAPDLPTAAPPRDALDVVSPREVPAVPVEPDASDTRAFVAVDNEATQVIGPPLAANPQPSTAVVPDRTAETTHAAVDLDPEAEREHLWTLLKFVARQEPGLRWALGKRQDGTKVVVTDLAYGWIPPGITLPGGVRLLEPERRGGNAAELIGSSALAITYAPGDPLGWATNSTATETSVQPRELPVVDDLGWLLSEATHWRDGLPRMVHTLAKAGAAGTGVLEAEIDVLRVHLDTARYQLLAQYPDVDSALLLNCLLLAATEGIATGDQLSANYHFAWYQKLNTPPASKWVSDP